MFNPSILKKTLSFISSLNKYSLIYHKDSDGVCSAVLFSKMMGKPEIVSPNDSTGVKISENLFKKINELPQAVFTDLPVDQISYEKILTKTLVIDHHIPTKNLNEVYPQRFIHVNPRFQDPEIYLPASYIVYKIIEKINKKVEKYSWIAGVGVVGDKGVENCRDLIKLIGKKYPSLSIKDNSSIWESELGFLSKLIDSSKGIAGIKGIIKSYEIFYKAESPDDIKNTELIKYYQKFQRELENLMLDFKYHSEHFPKTNSYLYKVISKYNIESTLSTILSEKNPDAAIFVYRIKNGLHISARCQTARINVAEVLKKLSKGIGSGGGHPQAAAASIQEKHISLFLERLKNFLEGI